MGDSDADLRIIEHLLVRGAVCATCLARQVGLVGGEGARVVARVERTLILAHETARCETCDAETTVYGIRGGRRFPFPSNGNGASPPPNGGPPPAGRPDR